MQQYVDILGTDLVKNSRDTINNNIKTVGSNYSGTAFPTNNRTDRKELYIYVPYDEDDEQPWKLLLKLTNSGEALVVNSTNSEYVNHENTVVLPDGTIMWVE